MRKFLLFLVGVSTVSLALAQAPKPGTAAKPANSSAVKPTTPTVAPVAPSTSGPVKLINFEKTTHDFGTVKEEDGDIAYAFKFTNTSASPVKLTYVKASCGCTTPKWTTDVIQPGKTGEVEAKYGTRGRPNEFTKTITVRAATLDNVNSNNEDIDVSKSQTLMLTIKGNVTPRPKGVADWYPFEDGALRYSTNHAAFGQIFTNEKKSKEFIVYNQSKRTITIDYIEPSKKHITYEFLNGQTIKANDSIKVKVTYDATAVNDFDFLHERAKMMTNDSVAEKTLYVSADVKEYFPPLTEEQKAKAPKAVYSATSYDYGTITEGDKATYDYILTNEGKSELVIRKSKASCGCTASQPEKMKLAPGESTKIKVTFDSSGKPGKQSKDVTVVTNDPVNPVTKLKIAGEVKKKDAPAGGDNHDGHDHSDPNHKH